MKPSGKYLSYEKRVLLKELLDKGLTQTQIAKILECGRKTVYNEIQRGTVDGVYDPDAAEKITRENQSAKGREVKLSLHTGTAEFIAGCILQDGLSPESISRRLKQDADGKKLQYVSPGTIYSAIDKGLIPGVTRKSLRRNETTVFCGNIRLPDWVRQETGINDGDSISIEIDGGRIILSKINAAE